MSKAGSVVYYAPCLPFYAPLARDLALFDSCCLFHSSNSFLPSFDSEKAIISGSKHRAIASSSCLGIFISNCPDLSLKIMNINFKNSLTLFVR